MEKSPLKETYMMLLDANYILRYLLHDHDEMFMTAKEVIENHHCFVLNEVMAEVVYVLEGVYKVPREEIVTVLGKFVALDNIALSESKKILLSALHLYHDKKLDFVDSYLCALKQKYEVQTFDKKLRKCLTV